MVMLGAEGPKVRLSLQSYPVSTQLLATSVHIKALTQHTFWINKLKVSFPKERQKRKKADNMCLCDRCDVSVREKACIVEVDGKKSQLQISQLPVPVAAVILMSVAGNTFQESAKSHFPLVVQ